MLRSFLLFIFLLLITPLALADPLPRQCKVNREGRLQCSLQGTTRGRALQKFDATTFPMDQIRKSRSPLSVGLPFAGRLHRPAAMPVSGKGFLLLARTQERNHGWALPELVELLTSSAARVARLYPKSILTVGDLSPRGGGYAPGHRSHQSGRDVDLGFYIVDGRSRYQIVTTEFVHFNESARGSGKYAHLMFDLERNWEFVEALVSHKTVHVQKIFISSQLRDLLLQYADAVARPADVLRRARAALSVDTAHGDHFHVRIACPDNQPHCR
ncbi:penicillin-insensitive murein endopeptidase [Myxococcota bacterium]|nr:penicillin-insensitive murein endopeptidase [Myxococcota bacterium]